MITRIVKMSFEPEKTLEFLDLFERTKQKIRHFDGCTFLELWEAKDEAGVFFTHSRWESAGHLETYRHSDLFRETWKNTKALFRAKAEAWTVDTASSTT